MKLLPILTTTALLAVLEPAFAGGAWEFVGARGISPDLAISGDLECNPHTGRLYLTYKAMHLFNDGVSAHVFDEGTQSWVQLGSDGDVSLGSSWYNQLAFGRDGTVYVAGREYALNGKASLRAWNGTSWESIGGPASLDHAHHVQIGMSRNDMPILAFQDRASNPPDRTGIMAYAGGEWHSMGNPPQLNASTSYQSLAIDRLGRPWIAVADSEREGRASVVRFRPGQGGWVPAGSLGFTPDANVENLSLAFDEQGVAHVAYLIWHQRLVVMKFGGHGWIQVGNTPASVNDQPGLQTEHWRQWISLRFDSANRPYVAYQDYPYYRVTVRRLNLATQEWETVGPAEFSPDHANYLSFTIGTDDRPYVSFRDVPYGGRMSVMTWTGD